MVEKSALLVNKLISRGFSICFAESCTGGMLCSRIVDVPNASSVLNMSFVTYANTAKTLLLGVSADTILQYGVVSEPVAGQMAKGAASAANADVAVGVSGIAGPSGGSDLKPVGTVCFGFYVCGNLNTYTQHFINLDRTGVRTAAVDYAIDTLLNLLK